MALRLITEKKEITVIVVDFNDEIIAIPKNKKEEKHKLLASFTGVPLTPSELDKIQKSRKTTEWDAPTKKQQKIRHEGTNWLEVTKDRICKTLTGWKDVLDSAGKPIEFNHENIITAWEMNTDIFNKVMDVFDNVSDEKTKEEKDQKKD